MPQEFVRYKCGKKWQEKSGKFKHCHFVDFWKSGVDFATATKSIFLNQGTKWAKR